MEVGEKSVGDRKRGERGGCSHLELLHGTFTEGGGQLICRPPPPWDLLEDENK